MRVGKRGDLTAERLRGLLDYNPDTGVFTWRTRELRAGRMAQYDKTWNVRWAGRVAGCKYSKGRGSVYLEIVIDYVHHDAHRLAWLYVHGEHPKHQIDHRDRDGTNNAIANLRDVSTYVNSINKGLRSDNTSGRVGVRWVEKQARWLAQIHIGGRGIFLGYHNRFDDACAARAKAESVYQADK